MMIVTKLRDINRILDFYIEVDIRFITEPHESHFALRTLSNIFVILLKIQHLVGARILT